MMPQRYVLGDWGTTRLRLYLMQQGRVLETREGPGVGQSEATADLLTTMVAAWASGTEPLDITLCGMASSRTGLHEVPYVQAPATFSDWAQGACRLPGGVHNIRLATGVQCRDSYGGFDVMRGEETQILGRVTWIPRSTRAVNVSYYLARTSKWVEVRDGSIVQFRTAITGEIYGLLKQHSILFKVGARDNAGGAADFDAGFAAGEQRSADGQEGLLTAGFSARTAQLLQARSHSWASGYVSGLLIGSEVATLSKVFAKSERVTLIGETQLANLYERVLTARGQGVRILDGAESVLRGLQVLESALAREQSMMLAQLLNHGVPPIVAILRGIRPRKSSGLRKGSSQPAYASSKCH